MATIKFGAIVTDMRGKLGGHVFQKGNKSLVMKTNRVPRRNISSFVIISQDKVNAVSAAWNVLTNTVKRQWTLLSFESVKKSKFGDTTVLSGRNLFVFLGNNLANTAQSLPPNPANLNPIVDSMQLLTAVVNTGTGQVVTTSTGTKLGMVFIIKAYFKRGFAGNARPSQFIFMTTGNNPTLASTGVYGQIVARWGTPLVTDTIYFQLITVNTSGFSNKGQIIRATIS